MGEERREGGREKKMEKQRVKGEGAEGVSSQ